MKCPQCGFEFGDLQAKKMDEYFDTFDETILIRHFECPRCKAVVENSIENYEEGSE